MALAWWSLPLLLLAALVLAEQFALLQREGKIYLKQLPQRPRWQVSPDELPRLRRATRWSKHLFGWLSLVCTLMIFYRLSLATFPPPAFLAASGLLLALWSSLQFPGYWRNEWRGFGALLVFTLTFPWVMLLIDWIVGAHPSLLLGFTRDLEQLGVDSPNKVQVAWFVTLMLCALAVAARIAVILMFNIPALLFANVLALKARYLGVAKELNLLAVVSALLLLLGSLALAWAY